MRTLVCVGVCVCVCVRVRALVCVGGGGARLVCLIRALNNEMALA